MSADGFARFFEEVHGYAPFPWQAAVVEETAERGTWPGMVDVPTGLGKTSMLDMAVFLLAMSAGGEVPAGLGRRRIYLVVDRRIVVDQAGEHGLKIAAALAEAAPGSVCHQVAARLRGLAGAGSEGRPLRVVKMRGGVTWDAAWLPRPDLPAIITGTVDQVGSRLFFRGYGVSPRRRPIDAALVGTDSVIMIDEAHLAQAFTTSLASAREADASDVLGLPETSVIHLSATNAGRPRGWVASFDEDAHAGNPVARQRLTAVKALTFVDSDNGRALDEKRAVDVMVSRASELAGQPDARVLVVCNTVNRAREVHQALSAGKSRLTDTEVLLLMGRSRPLDREPIAKRVTELFGAGRPAQPGPAVLVATQTVEVGIDLDATALVTECASWDALVQRFGRVNRRGDLDAASVIVVEDNAKEPPVYGEAKVATAGFLRSQTADGAALDVSPLALRHLPIPEGLVAPAPPLPLLLPAHLDAWARTSPAPSNDPPVDPYLHGIDTSTAPVTVAWRDGLLDGLGEAGGEPLSPGEAGAAINALPLRSEETVEVPLQAVRVWLANLGSVEGESRAKLAKPAPFGDVDDFDDFDDVPFGGGGKHLLRRSPEGSWAWVGAAELRPGDVVAAPSEYGGLDRFGWNPGSTPPVHEVQDVGELAALRRDQVVLRLDDSLHKRLGLPEIPGLPGLVADWRNADDPQERKEAEASLVACIQHWLAAGSEPVSELAGDSPWTPEDVELLRDRLNQQVTVVSGEGESPAVLLRAVVPEHGWRAVNEDSTADTSSLDQRVGLAAHLDAVGARAEAIATRLGLPEPVWRTVADAARWHDLGKVDRRFQAMLFGGSDIAAELADEPLAKSGMPPGDRELHRRARRLSGLPSGARHEAWSEVIVAAYLAALPEPYPGDADLVRHLVASHHGHARPLLPPVADPGGHDLDTRIGDVAVTVPLPVGVRLSDADRFARLNRRYGRWGLALLEAVVRCADMTVSSEGS